MLPAWTLVVPLGLHLVVEERCHGKESLVPLPARLSRLRSRCHCAHAHVHGPRTWVNESVRDSRPVQRCGCGCGLCHGLTSSILYFRKFLCWAHSQAERMRDPERGREILLPSANHVTENHQQSSCLSFSFIQTPNSPLQQITFQHSRLFCL